MARAAIRNSFFLLILLVINKVLPPTGARLTWRNYDEKTNRANFWADFSLCHVAHSFRFQKAIYQALTKTIATEKRGQKEAKCHEKSPKSNFCNKKKEESNSAFCGSQTWSVRNNFVTLQLDAAKARDEASPRPRLRNN